MCYLFLSPIHMFEFWRQAFGTALQTAGLLHWPINFKQTNQRKKCNVVH